MVKIWLVDLNKTQIMGESKLGAILVFLRRTDGSRTVRLLTADGPPW